MNQSRIIGCGVHLRWMVNLPDLAPSKVKVSLNSSSSITLVRVMMHLPILSWNLQKLKKIKQPHKVQTQYSKSLAPKWKQDGPKEFTFPKVSWSQTSNMSKSCNPSSTTKSNVWFHTGLRVLFRTWDSQEQWVPKSCWTSKSWNKVTQWNIRQVGGR